MRHFIVGLTGASCSIYGIRFVQFLANAGHQVTVIFTENGLRVACYELKKKYPKNNSNEILNTFFTNIENIQIKVEDNKNIFAPCASGSNSGEALIIFPCSMGTLGAIASGLSNNLLQRVADVMLKERRQLILCTREAPYSLIHLRNMVSITEAGGVIIPCSPGFYMHPESLDDIINFMVGKVLDTLKVPHQISPRWQETQSDFLAGRF